MSYLSRQRSISKNYSEREYLRLKDIKKAPVTLTPLDTVFNGIEGCHK